LEPSGIARGQQGGSPGTKPTLVLALVAAALALPGVATADPTGGDAGTAPSEAASHGGTGSPASPEGSGNANGHDRPDDIPVTATEAGTDGETQQGAAVGETQQGAAVDQSASATASAEQHGNGNANGHGDDGPGNGNGNAYGHGDGNGNAHTEIRVSDPGPGEGVNQERRRCDRVCDCVRHGRDRR
jgi:hypothetical protein